ncbi:MAG: hypothetical protein JWQ32_388, partial [Marmoricola sp.]|nr:hypothetical protein [Marmoricola sp.]
MAWVVLAVAIGLAILAAVLAVTLLRLTRRLASLEARLAPGPSSDPPGR